LSDKNVLWKWEKHKNERLNCVGVFKFF
jgi:hypothetical protein